MMYPFLAGVVLYFLFCVVCDNIEKRLPSGSIKILIGRALVTAVFLCFVAEVFRNFGLLGFGIAAVTDLVMVYRATLRRGEK